MKKILFLFLFILISMSLFARPTLIINEFMYDTPGTDTNCYLELKGIPGEVLDSVKVIGINGNGGAIYNIISLHGKVVPADSYYVIGQTSAILNYDTATTMVDYQNGTCDNIQIVYDSIGLASRLVLDAVCYGLPAASESVFRGEIWPTYDIAPLTGPPIYFAAMSRHSSVDFNNNYYDFAQYMVKTPGMANIPSKNVTVYDIQFSADSFSTIKDSTVRTEPLLVTAVFDSIYYVSSLSGGEWSGVCVYRDIRQTPWAVGDSIRLVHGLVWENYKRTEIRSPGTALYAAGNDPSVIVPTQIAISDIGESYEGVLIKMNNLIVATAPDANGEWKVTNGTDTLSIDNMALYSVPAVGQGIKSITGILDYSFNTYKLQPRGNSDIVLGQILILDGIVSLNDSPVDSSGTIVTLRDHAFSDTTDIHGYYNIPNIIENTYTVVFEHSGYSTDSVIIDLTSDSTYNFTLLSGTIPTYSLSGIIGLNDDPSDSSGISVSLADTSIVQEIETDSLGYYEFTGITAGMYTLVITKLYYSQDSIDIDISSDTTYNTDIDRLLGTLWGYIGLSDNPADSSLSEAAIGELGFIDSTSANGAYSFNNVPLGIDYSVIFTHNGYQPDTVDFFLTVSSTRQDATLQKLAGLDEAFERIVVNNEEGAGLSVVYSKGTDAITTMRIYDLTGRNIVTQDVAGSKGVYKLSIAKELSKGVYFIQITGEDKPFIKKFVIVK